MKTSYLKSFHPFIFILLVAVVQLDLFIQTLFMGRRAKVRFMHRTLLLHTRSRRS